MKKLTNAELAILTLVAEQPHHGYEIEQIIEARGMREWTEVGFSSIYYILKKLESAELITGAIEAAERGSTRNVYQITAAGCEALRASMIDVLSTPRPDHSPLLLGLANLSILPAAEALAALTAYRDRLAARHAFVRERHASQQPLAPFVNAMFERNQALMQAELDWLARFLARLRADAGDAANPER